MSTDTQTAPARVLIVDDHPVVREGLRSVLSERDELTVVGEAATMAEAIEQARGLEPDTIVMDLRLPDGDGVEASREIRSLRPETQIVILTSHADRDALLAAVMAGAAGFLLKTLDAKATQDAIVTASRGESLIRPERIAELVSEFGEPSGGDDDPDFDALTKREVSILELIAEGLTNTQIGDELGLSSKTIKNYVSDIYSKLGVRNRAEATVRAIERDTRRVRD